MTQEETDKIFNAITSNGCREMDEIRFNQAVNEALDKVNVVLGDVIKRSDVRDELAIIMGELIYLRDDTSDWNNKSCYKEKIKAIDTLLKLEKGEKSVL